MTLLGKRSLTVYLSFVSSTVSSKCWHFKVDNDIVRQDSFDSVFELFVPLYQVSIDISTPTMISSGKMASTVCLSFLCSTVSGKCWHFKVDNDIGQQEGFDSVFELCSFVGSTE